MSRPFPPVRRTAQTALFVALASALVATGCSKSDSESDAAQVAVPASSARGAGSDRAALRSEARTEVVRLQAQEPHVWVRETGSIRPALDDGLGDADLGGWEERAETVAGVDVPVVWSRSRRTALALERVRPTDTTIRVQLVGVERPPGWRPVQITARLGGVEIGVRDVEARLESFEFEAPAELWRTGRNTLTFEMERFEFISSDEDSWGSKFRGIALASLSIGESRPAHRDGERVLLSDGTAARWKLEEGGAGTLEVRGSAAEYGAVGMRVGLVDPYDGTVLGWSERELVECDRGASFEHAFEVLPSPGRQAFIELSWSSGADEPQDAALVIEGAVLRREVSGTTPPVVFISIDTLSARNMSLYGYERETTPQLERFAQDAVVFETCRSNSPWTVPSYLSQFTGLLPEASWSPELSKTPFKQIGWEGRSIAPQRWTLAEMMRARGYSTFAAVDNPWLNKIPGLEQGFDVYDTEPSRIGHGESSGGLELVLELARERLREQGWTLSAGDDDSGRAPYFHFLQSLDVHGPYLPSAEFAGRFGSDRLARESAKDLPVVRRITPVFGAVRRGMTAGLVDFDAEDDHVSGAALRALYDEGILEMDARLGRYFDWLREQGLYDDALIVVTADHGDQMEDTPFLFDHGLPYEHTSLVPLIVKLPGNAQAGARIDTPVELVDLYATFADLVGIEPSSRTLHGRSLLDLIEGRTGDSQPFFLLDGSSGSRAVVDGRWKLVVHLFVHESPESVFSYPDALRDWLEANPELAAEMLAALGIDDVGERLFVEDLKEKVGVELYRRINSAVQAQEHNELRFELYDLETDPAELVDVSAEHPAVVERLLMLLMRRSIALRDLRMRVASQPVRELDAGESAVLEALGYKVGD